MTPDKRKLANGAVLIGERRWADSPAYHDAIQVLKEMGLEVTASPKTGVDWPSPDRRVRDRFHARWTEVMQQRCGFDPLRPTNYGTIRQERNEKRKAKMREVAELFRDGVPVPAIAEQVGSDVRTIRHWLAGMGLRERISAKKKGRPFKHGYYAEP